MSESRCLLEGNHSRKKDWELGLEGAYATFTLVNLRLSLSNQVNRKSLALSKTLPKTKTVN